MTAYWFTFRPKNVEHQHRYLVFDGHDHLHLPLTTFGKEISQRLSPKTVQTYLYATLPWFDYLDTDVWQIRQAVEDYLVSKLRCKVQPHQHGWRFVAMTTGTQSSLQIFLSALKLFYQVMITRGSYPFLNPLVEPIAATVAAIEARLVGQLPSPVALHMLSKSLTRGTERNPTGQDLASDPLVQTKTRSLGMW